MEHLVFVYGTSKRGHGNHNLLSNNEAKFIGTFKTQQGYSLFVEGLPYLVPREEGHGVVGELFLVDVETMTRLDHLEGHPTFYSRERIKLQGYEDEVWVYVYQEKCCDEFRNSTPEYYYKGY